MKRSTPKTRSKNSGSEAERSIPQELPEREPGGWREIQEKIATSSGLAFLLVEGHQPPALTVSNNNSICQALQTSPEHVKLCDPFCGEAHARAIAAGTITHYRCHAGLQCFAMPIEIDPTRGLAVIGGRAFVRSSDYRELVERVRSGDLQELFSNELFQNVIFADEADLDHAALRISSAARDFTLTARPGIAQPAIESEEPVAPIESDSFDELITESRPAETSTAFSLAESIRRFAEQIDATDPARTYESIVARSADLVGAERGSLLLFDQAANRLTMTAARGIPVLVADVGPIAVGEGIAGAVMRENRPLVATTDELGRISPAERRYKTKSFISYP